MVSFFKNFGKGVLYVLVLPFLLVGMAIYGVVALFVFIFLCFKGLILFFTGRSLYEDLPEDKEAKRRLALLSGEKQEGEINVSPLQNTVPPIQATPDNQAQDSISTDPFYVPEYLRTEEQQEEVEQEETQEQVSEEPQAQEEPVQENNNLFDNILTSEPEEKKPLPEEKHDEDVIVVQNTKQNSNIIEISDIDDDEEESSGINIDYD